jgi:DNA-binding PucR family transcriptional regulator
MKTGMSLSSRFEISVTFKRLRPRRSLTGELREQRKRDPDREETAAAEFPQTKS